MGPSCLKYFAKGDRFVKEGMIFHLMGHKHNVFLCPETPIIYILGKWWYKSGT